LDTLSTIQARKFKGRKGSVGSEILSRFKVIFDYPNSKVTLKKNGKFNRAFKYNMSGIEVVYGGQIIVKELEETSFQISKSEGLNSQSNTISFSINYKYKFRPLYKISNIREGSPAEEAGIKEGDLILKVNGKNSYDYDLQEIIGKFYEKDNKKIKLLIDRNGVRLKFEFRLKKIL